MVFSVTQALIEHISSMGFEASSMLPKDIGDVHVTVERVGGTITDKIDHPVMAVQVWAKTDDKAEAAANSLVVGLCTTKPPRGVHSIKVQTAAYPFVDPQTRKPRYQFVLELATQLEVKE